MVLGVVETLDGGARLHSGIMKANQSPAPYLVAFAANV